MGRGRAREGVGMGLALRQWGAERRPSGLRMLTAETQKALVEVGSDGEGKELNLTSW